jgi:hypothetical protein
MHTMKDSRSSSFPVVCGTALWLLLGSLSAPAAEPVLAGELQLQPASLTLSQPRQPHSILVSGTNADGQIIDLTGSASFTSADEKIAVVDSFGWVKPIAVGKTTITIKAAGKSATLPVSVDLKLGPKTISFRHDVMPVFSRGGCNSGACHGYSLGKNGFKLSLRGGDETADYASLTRRRDVRHPRQLDSRRRSQ